MISYEQEVGARLAESEQRMPMPAGQDDFAQLLASSYFLMVDETSIGIAMADPELREMIPALSHLIRTSNLNPKTVELMKIQWRIICRMQLLVKKDAQLASYTKFLVWLNYGYACLEDAIGGWRGKLVTERIRTYKIETQTQKKGRLFGLLG